MNQYPILSNLSLPILRGKLKGKKWIVSAGGKILRLFFSTYEPEQTMLFINKLKEGDVVFDVGAHIGYYTLLSSEIVGSAGKVVAFEPDPKNSYYLRKHICINRTDNVTIVNKAVTENDGYTCFEQGSGTGTGHVSGTGSLRIETISIDSYIEKTGVVPAFIKIDTEGAEVMVLNGAKRLLSSKRPVIFLSTHGKSIHEECCRLLSSLGYRFEPITGVDIANTSELLCYPG
jgi:FkbM family methyltransferase